MTKRQPGVGLSTRGEGRTAGRVWAAVATAFVVAVVSSEPAGACAVCYGAEDSAMTAGMNNAILVLLGVVVVVQASFAALFLSLRQRARRARSQGEEPGPGHGGTP